MKPAPFTYHRPTRIADAVALLDENAGAARVLAGGQSLVPMLNMRLFQPDVLVDINEIDELDGIEATGEALTIGALVRYSALERSAAVAERLPLLSTMVRHIGDRQVRNRGTLGGSLVHADPTGEMPLACLTLDASVVVMSVAGMRTIPLGELYLGSYATSLEPNEMLVAVTFPPAPTHSAFGEICRKHNDFALVSVAATADRAADGTWSSVHLGLGGVADTPIRVPGAEAVLEGSALTDADIGAAAEAVLEEIDPPTDIRASAEYRTHLTPVQVRRVLTRLRDAAHPHQSEKTGHQS